MKLMWPLIMALMGNVAAAVEGSVSYTIYSDVVDGGGIHSQTATYANDGSIGGFGGLVTASPSQETDRIGYAGQLYEVTALTLTAPSTNVNAAATLPLYALEILDDQTVTPADSFVQWSFTNPIISVSAAGILTAANVDQDTPALVHASLEGLSAALNLMVLNVGIPPGFNRISALYIGGNQMRFSFTGSSGASYALDRSYNLSPPVSWVPQITNFANTNGLLILTNIANPSTNNFWRIRLIQ